MPLPSRTTEIQTYNGDKIVCAKFTVPEANTEFKFPRLISLNGTYQFQMIAKASAASQITVKVGNVSKTFTVTPSFGEFSAQFDNVDATTSRAMIFILPAGTFWFYNIQLEKASSPSAWRPAPEDGNDYADEVSKAAVDAQTQASIFDKLTNGGQTQGIYLSNGRLYINASYIQTGTFSVKKGDVQTFYVNADTGTVRIIADELAITGQSALATEDYVDRKAEEAVDSQTQAEIFNKLTNNGQTQGIYLQNGKIYINASYMATGILADAGGNVSWNLTTGALSAKQLSIDSTNFKLTTSGDITANSGTFNNVTIQSGCNLAPVSSQVVSNATQDIKNIIAGTVTADYITSKSAVLGKMSIDESGYVRLDGGFRATLSLYTNEVFSNSYWVGSNQGTSSTMKINGADFFSFNNGIYTGADKNITVKPSAKVNLYFTSDGKCSPTWKSGYTVSSVSVVYN